MQYSEALIAQYAKPVPRYTSYPTAPHFNATVQGSTVRRWMKDIPESEAVSLYLHIPFCDRLCWFCGCHTKHTLKYEPVKTYLKSLYKEIELTRHIIGRKQKLAHIHLGGGSPSLLRAAELKKLKAVLDDNFTINCATEISLEFDPTDLDTERLKAFTEFGLTRASLGVQDFDLKVQETINRLQSFKQTKFVVDTLRTQGVSSLNIDALYGLPYQSLATLSKTLEQVCALSPDRIALFGYAHVPWVKRHQNLIDETALPSSIERFEQARFAEAFLASNGFKAIGIDHFAKAGDSLNTALDARKIHRNFQGYTTDNCSTLIGLGVSSISQFRQGYAQNVKDTHSYRRLLEEDCLPAARGITRSAEDKLTSAAINELMCYFTLSGDELIQTFGSKAQKLIAIASRVALEDDQGFFIQKGQNFEITERGKPFARTIASYFDPYLETDTAQYSTAV
jgi:oxygen-independent coproporphyrinogen-3 oxidase